MCGSIWGDLNCISAAPQNLPSEPDPGHGWGCLRSPYFYENLTRLCLFLQDSMLLTILLGT